MLELCRHRDSVQHKVWLHPLHEGGKADVRVGLIAHCHEEGGRKVGHSLDKHR